MDYLSFERNLYFDNRREYSPTGRSIQEDIEHFHLPVQQMHHAGLHGFGIISGLEVEGLLGDDSLTVQAGLALDYEGNLISLSNSGRAEIGSDPYAGTTQETSVPVALPLAEYAGKTAYVTIEAFELVDRGTRPPKLEQVPWLRLRPLGEEEPVAEIESGRALVLAIIRIDETGKLAALSEYSPDSGVSRGASPSLTAASLLLRRPVSFDNRVHTAVVGSLSTTANGDLELSVTQGTADIVLGSKSTPHFRSLTVEADDAWFAGNLHLRGRLSLTGGITIGARNEPAAASTFDLPAVGSALNSLAGFAQLTIEHKSVPLAVRESGREVDQGGLWRMPLDSGTLRFDVNTGPDGMEFGSNYLTVLAMSHEGNIGVGTETPMGRLDVRGAILAGNSDIYFTNVNHVHTGRGNEPGVAAIENSSDYDALMILGRSNTSNGRSVKLWDYLQVNGNLDVTGSIGGRLRSLDTAEHLYAQVRSHDLYFGHSQRGTKRNGGAQGRALVDSGTNLVVNFGPDWASTVIGSDTQVDGNLAVLGRISGQLSGLDVAPTHSARVRCSDFLIGGSGDRGPERRALVAWADMLEINHNYDWRQCRVNGFVNGSSRDLKDNIATLDTVKAMETLQLLRPTEFSTKGNEHRRFYGFIAEETPDLVASDDRKGIYLDGILSVLTRVVQEQQREIDSLKAQMAQGQTR